MKKNKRNQKRLLRMAEVAGSKVAEIVVKGVQKIREDEKT